MVYKAAIAYMNDVQFTTLKHEHGYFSVYLINSMSWWDWNISVRKQDASVLNCG